MPVKISIVICTYNRAQFLPGLFHSIIAQTLNKTSFEILLINNNSTDTTKQLCLEFIEQHPDLSILYFDESQQGLSFARNRGIKEAQGQYITFADDDALIAPDFLEKACSFLGNHPDVAEVGGPIFLKYLGNIPKWENPYINSLLGYFKPSETEYRMRAKNRRYPRGSNMTFRKEIFNTCGLFNTALGRTKHQLTGGEEKDIAFRIFEQGYTIAYTPEIIVYHLVPEERTTKTFIKQQALGTGKSEKLRTFPSQGYYKRLGVEGFKWAATLILWLRYLLTGKPQKANMLVQFRFWVTKGLLSKIN